MMKAKIVENSSFKRWLSRLNFIAFKSEAIVENTHANQGPTVDGQFS